MIRPNSVVRLTWLVVISHDYCQRDEKSCKVYAKTTTRRRKIFFTGYQKIAYFLSPLRIDKLFEENCKVDFTDLLQSSLKKIIRDVQLYMKEFILQFLVLQFSFENDSYVPPFIVGYLQ